MPEPTTVKPDILRDKDADKITEKRIQFATFLSKIEAGLTVQFFPTVGKMVSSRHALISNACGRATREIVNGYPFTCVQDGGLLVDFVME